MMKRYIKEFVDYHGLLGIIRLIIYPVSSLILNPIYLIKTIINLKILFKGQWSNLSRLSVYRSFNSSWHKAYDLFIERYGRNGYCYNISLGQTLTNKFYYTKLSMRLYAYNDVIVPWLGVCLFLICFLFWINATGIGYLQFIIIIYIIFTSSQFYYNAFEALKYDSLGWSFVPLVFWGLISGNLYISMFSLLAISFLSISVLIPVLVLYLSTSFFINTFSFIYAVPAIVKFLMHFRYLSDFESLLSILNGIGSTRKGKKIRKKKLGLDGIYYTVTWGVYLVYLYYFGSTSSVLPKDFQVFSICIAISLFLINKLLLRFADDQTLYMMSLFTFSMVSLFQPSPYFLFFLILAISPPPILLGFAGEKYPHVLDKLPVRKPFDTEPGTKLMQKFLSKVDDYDRILFNFKFRTDEYPNFDGYKAVKEFAHFIALKRNIILFPDYYAIFDHYADIFPVDKIYTDLSSQSLLDGLQIIGGNYIILPSHSRSIPATFENLGFSVVDSLDLRLLYNDNDYGTMVFPEYKPYWLLIKSPKQSSICEKGRIIEIKPNSMKCKLDKTGYALIKFLFDRGWKSDTEVKINRNETYGWIELIGNPEQMVTLNYQV